MQVVSSLQTSSTPIPYENWLMAIFPPVVMLNLVKWRQSLVCSLWSKCPTQLSVEISDVFKIKYDYDDDDGHSLNAMHWTTYEFNILPKTQWMSLTSTQERYANSELLTYYLVFNSNLQWHIRGHRCWLGFLFDCTLHVWCCDAYSSGKDYFDQILFLTLVTLNITE